MRTFDESEVEELNAEQWQIDLLKLNPEYVYWGPHEDSMWNEGEGWQGRVIVGSWAEFGPWRLNELNECVNFYFSVNRADEECGECGGNGYHPDAQKIVNSFYEHQCESVGLRRLDAWNDKITQDEVQALVDANRLIDFTSVFIPGEGWKKKDPHFIPTAEEVNAWQRGRGMGHDAINRHILIEARTKRLGIPRTCPECNGSGRIFTAPKAHASLTLWWLHPRKGCSRGIEVSRIEESDLPAIFKFLSDAADRNAERFSKIKEAA